MALFSGVGEREGERVAGFAVLADGDAGGVASCRGADVGPGCRLALADARLGWRRLDMEREEREESDDDDGESRREELIDEANCSGRRVKDDDWSGLSFAEWET